MYNKTWIVRVYDGDNCVKWWLIRDRTESEAGKEAEAEIAQFYSGPAPSQGEYDWTMIEDNLAHLMANVAHLAGG